MNLGLGIRWPVSIGMPLAVIAGSIVVPRPMRNRNRAAAAQDTGPRRAR